MDKNKKHQYFLACHNALLFNITYHTRLVIADIIDNELIIWVYLDKVPNEHEKDAYYSASAELKGEFIELSSSKVYFLTEPFSEVSIKDRLLLFARCDYLDSEGNLIE